MGEQEVGFPGGMKPDYWAHRWWMLIASGGAIAFASKDGAGIGGILQEDIHNGDLVAVEGFWFVPPAARGRQGLQLLEAWEAAVREAGAVRVSLGHHDIPAAPRMKRMYQRLGYELASYNYTKDL